MSKGRPVKPLKPQNKVSKPATGNIQSGFNLNKFFEEKGFYLLLFLIAVIAFVIYSDFISFKNVLIYKDIGSDTYTQFVPSLVHFTSYLRTEGIPKWSFNQGMGQNVFPGGINDPFSLFLFLFDSSHIAYAIAYAQLLKILLGGIIFYYYLRTIGISHFASIAGALTFSFSGYMILGGGWYGHASSVVYGAFLLFSFEKFYKKNTWVYFPLAVAIISADVFALYIYTVFLFLYTLLRYYQENDFKSTGIIKLLLSMAGLGLLGVAINAVFLVSPLLQMIDSPRVSGEAGLFNALKAAPIFAFADTIELMSAVMRSFSSDLMGTGNNFRGWTNYLEAPIFYVGLINLLLLPQVFQFLDRRQKILFEIFLGIWLLIISFPYFRHSLYLFAGDYYKAGLSFFVPVSVIYTGITALSCMDRLNKINFKVLIGTLVVLLALLFYSYFPSGQKIVDTNLRSVVTFYLFLYAIAIGLFSFKKYNTAARILLLLILVSELIYFSSFTVNKRSIVSGKELNQKVGYNDYTIEAVNYLKAMDKSFYRVNKDYRSGIAMHGSLNDAMIQDYYGTPSYQSFNQLYYIKFLTAAGVINGAKEGETRWAMGLINRPMLQTVASIKYSLTKKTDSNLQGMGNELLTTIGDVSIFRNPYYLPLGYTYDSFILQKDFKSMSDFQKDKTLFQAFTVDENQKEKYREFSIFNPKDSTGNLTFEEYRKYIDERKKDTLAMVSHTQNLIKGKISLDKKKLLFFSIPYDMGWSAKVDGKGAALELVTFGFMGIILDKGIHEVELKFVPPFVNESLWISIFGVLLYLAGVTIWLYRKNVNT